ncbi:MAG TPA: serine/threonine-protein kinase, partial [Nostocaceae cyanobacterium]|nr:serine/threonine-protein kinase [Nostocaceae cyanobacterium]
ACHNPPNPDGTKFCSNCGVPLVVLRHYRPIRVLGSGGFGKTYLAEDVEKFNEQCVIKQFAPQVQGSGSLQKATELFEQEARRLQQLGEHPQIPTLYAYFEEDKRLYLVQQFIAGQNLLEELQEQGIFSEFKIRKLLLDLLNTLQTVHQHQVIHRDIKPQNILRRKSSPVPSQNGVNITQNQGDLVLIDFGASKQLSETVVTQGTTIGSFGYAPLEQMQDGQAYPASDLFSLAATCFHLLTNITPWELWKQQGYSWVNNWQQYLKQPLSEELAAILKKMLQPNYQQRYQSTEAVLHDLSSLSPLLDMPPTATFYPAELAPNLPLTEPYQPILPQENLPSSVNDQLTSPVVELPQKALKFKKPILLSSFILILGFCGYGIWQFINYSSGTTIAYDKLALANSLNGHKDFVNTLAISPDSKVLASGSGDRTIKLWNLQTGGLQTSLALHTDAITSVAISPDGKTLVSSSKDGTIKVWNISNGSLKNTISASKYWVNSVAISPDGLKLVSGDNNNQVKLWDLATGKIIRTITGHNDKVWRVVISPDGKNIVSSSYDNTIKIWDLETGTLKKTLSGHSALIYDLAISPDGKILVSASLDKTIKIWDLHTGDLKNTLGLHKFGVTSLAISPDGKTLFSGSFDNTVKVWDLNTGELKNTFSEHTDLVYAVVMSPDGQTLVSSSKDNTIKIWHLR